MVLSVANSLQTSIESMATQLFNAFSSKRPDLCADCYEQYGIVSVNKQENLIGQAEIALYWERLVAKGVSVLERSTPQITFNRPNMFTVQSVWSLNTGQQLTLCDTWARQTDGSFKLLMQNIKGELTL